MSFEISVEDLKALIRDRTVDSDQKLAGMGGATGVASLLKVDPNTGLSPDNTEDLEQRREAFGKNYIDPAKTKTYWDLFVAAFSDFTILMLCGAAFVALLLALLVEKTASAYAEAVAILFSIMLVTNVAAANDYKKQLQFQKLNAVVENVPIYTKRGGNFQDVPIAEVCVGDVVALRVGDLLCADGILLEGHGVYTDESALTGEPKLIEKNKEKPFLLSGTKVMEGSGAFLVIAVGEHSESGQIKALVTGKKNLGGHEEGEGEEEEEKSVLTAKLDRMAILIGKFGTLVAVGCVLIMLIRFLITRYLVEDEDTRCALLSGETCFTEAITSIGSYPLCSLNSSETCCETHIDEDGETEALLRGSPCGWMKVHVGEMLYFLVNGITILVVAIPEGLPLAVTLSLAFSVMKMQDDNNLVKHLDACETMGSATTICSDKTGTLTKNRMTVMRAFLGGETFKADLNESVGKSVKSGGRLSDKFLELLSHGVAVNSTAEIKWHEEAQLWDQIGNKTDAALLALVHDLDCDWKDIREGPVYKDVDEYGQSCLGVHTYPFSSARKRSGVVVSLAKRPEGSGYRLFMKGASEMVLALCSQQMKIDGSVSSISEAEKEDIQKDVISVFASNAMRTICLAYRDFPSTEAWDEQIPVDMASVVSYKPESDLTLLGIVGIEDPLRDEVPEAISVCRQAGVDVRMVTGDNIDTAVAIAKGCGILRPGVDLDDSGNPLPNAALSGPDFRKRVLNKNNKIDQTKFDEIWPFLRVLARSSPTDKYVLVTGLIESDLFLMKRGRALGISPDRQIVAVTGDGTNDAPALKKADVGFAMGITGTEVAKDAADIILMDDNFLSIVKACKWGRNVYDSISKFLQFQLTINIAAIVITTIGSIVFSESPLKATQMLWVNIIMDSLASLALATEPPTDDLLTRPPYGRNKSLVTRKMKWNMGGQASYQVVVSLIILFCPSLFNVEDGTGQGHLAAPTSHFTLIFNAFVMMTLCNQVSARKLYHQLNIFEGLLSNPTFILILFIELGLQALLVQFGGVWFKTKPLSWSQWLFCILVGFGCWPFQYVIIFAARAAEARWPEKEEELADETSPQAAAGSQGARSSIGNISSKVLSNLGQMSSASIRNLMGATPTAQELQHMSAGGYKNAKRSEAVNQISKNMSSYGQNQTEKAMQKVARERSGSLGKVREM